MIADARILARLPAFGLMQRVDLADDGARSAGLVALRDALAAAASTAVCS
jgi:hypothetical protein